MNEEQWQTQFDLYKLSPEFAQVNSHFEISDYKNIFLWEFAHRLLGRVIFLFVVLPGFFLWRKKLVSGRLVLSLAGLIALQGLIGWLMVKTGLNARPHVSPYMLALHFFSALIVLLVAFYHLCKLRKPFAVGISTKPYSVLGILLGLQLFFGCITSGLKAGIGYNTYPLMNGQFMPEDAFALKPTLLNFLENPGTVQWIHRWLGMAVLLALLGCLFSMKKSASWGVLKGPMIHLAGVCAFQVLFGILNIVYIVPVPLAALHQLCAGFLVLSYFSIVFRMQNKVEPSSI